MATTKATGKSKKGRQHTHFQEKYRRQYARTAANKKIAWVKHLAIHKNDLQNKKDIHKAMENLKTIW